MAHAGVGAVGRVRTMIRPWKTPRAVVAHHALGQLVGEAVATDMIDLRRQVRMPLAGQHIGSVDPHRRSLARMFQAGLDALEPGTRGQDRL
jgi:hypothetical protein